MQMLHPIHFLCLKKFLYIIMCNTLAVLDTNFSDLEIAITGLNSFMAE